MNADVANFLWVGNQLSMYEFKCIESFVENRFKVHVYSYGDLELPIGALLKDGREILPETEVYSYTQNGRQGNLAAFSDAFRYELCKKKAGWWFDTDVFCLKNVNEWIKLAESNAGFFVFGWENEALVNGAVMYSDNQQFNDTVQKHLNQIGKSFFWGEIGPRLITKVVNEIGLIHKVVPQAYFYPISFNNLNYLFDPDFRAISNQAISDSFCVHLWNEYFTIHSIPKNIPPPAGSFLFDLLSKYSSLDDQYSLKLNTFRVLLNHPKTVERLQVLERKTFKGILLRIKNKCVKHLNIS